MTSTEQDVLEAAAAIVTAFGTSDMATYFDCFAEDATFLFFKNPEVFGSVAAYREAWAEWQHDDGLRVLSCSSSEQHVQDLGDVAVLTHRVATRVADNAGEEEMRERETIVFRRRDDGRWVAVHEHLSPDPADPADSADSAD